MLYKEGGMPSRGLVEERQYFKDKYGIELTREFTRNIIQVESLLQEKPGSAISGYSSALTKMLNEPKVKSNLKAFFEDLDELTNAISDRDSPKFQFANARAIEENIVAGNFGENSSKISKEDSKYVQSILSKSQDEARKLVEDFKITNKIEKSIETNRMFETFLTNYVNRKEDPKGLENSELYNKGVVKMIENSSAKAEEKIKFFLQDFDELCTTLNPQHTEKHNLANTKAIADYVNSLENINDLKPWDLSYVGSRIADAKDQHRDTAIDNQLDQAQAKLLANYQTLSDYIKKDGYESNYNPKFLADLDTKVEESKRPKEPQTSKEDIVSLAEVSVDIDDAKLKTDDPKVETIINDRLYQKYGVKFEPDFIKYITADDEYKEKHFDNHKESFAKLANQIDKKRFAEFVDDLDQLDITLNKGDARTYDFNNRAIADYVAKTNNPLEGLEKSDLEYLYCKIQDTKETVPNKELDDAQSKIKEALKPETQLLDKGSAFYKFMMENDVGSIARKIHSASNRKNPELANLKTADLVTHAPKELLDKISDVSKTLVKRENTNSIKLFAKDSIKTTESMLNKATDFVAQSLTGVRNKNTGFVVYHFKKLVNSFSKTISRKGNNIEGFKGAMEDLKKCADKHQPEYNIAEFLVKDEPKASNVNKFVEMLARQKHKQQKASRTL